MFFARNRSNEKNRNKNHPPNHSQKCFNKILTLPYLFHFLVFDSPHDCYKYTCQLLLLLNIIAYCSISFFFIFKKKTIHIMIQPFYILLISMQNISFHNKLYIDICYIRSIVLSVSHQRNIITAINETIHITKLFFNEQYVVRKQ